MFEQHAYTHRRVGPGEFVRRVRFGDEEDLPTSKGVCRDCSAQPGDLHHPRCCMERCANTGAQTLCCKTCDILAKDDSGRDAITTQDFDRKYGMPVDGYWVSQMRW